MQEAGIIKFKCATIAEAEMLALVEAEDVLLAYQPVGPKSKRLLDLIQRYPGNEVFLPIDNEETASELSNRFKQSGHLIPVYIDLNIGMNRTGIVPERALPLFRHCKTLSGIEVVGLHAYDGHIRDYDFNLREKRCDEPSQKL